MKVKGKLWIQQLRVHQWSKNILIFLPALTSFTLSGENLARLFWGLIIFSILASAIYIVNDLRDLEHDRRHKTKANRPMAAGLISFRQAIAVAIFLVIISIVQSVILQPVFSAVLFVYLSLALFYSFGGKSIAILDCILLAVLYSLRVIAGAVIIQVQVSNWLIAFCCFFFFSLSWIKRISEIRNSETPPDSQLPGRGYKTSDVPVLIGFGASSAISAILVFALYVDSEQSAKAYAAPEFVWLAMPFLFFWLARVWLLANRGEIDEDPIQFAIRDKVSFVCGLGVVLSIAIAHVGLKS